MYRAGTIVLTISWIGCGRVAFDPSGSSALVDSSPPDQAIVDVPLDTAMSGLIFEAENFTARTMFVLHQWTTETDVAGFSGTGFMRLTPADSGFCIPAGNVACTARLSFALTIPADGTYFLHARLLAPNTATDSVFYGVDNNPTTATFDVAEDSSWHPVTGNSFNLTTGPHTVDLWMREAGVRVDVLALTLSMTPPF